MDPDEEAETVASETAVPLSEAAVSAAAVLPVLSELPVVRLPQAAIETVIAPASITARLFVKKFLFIFASLIIEKLLFEILLCFYWFYSKIRVI